MARVAGDTLREPTGVYLASSLGLARAVEELLTSRGIEYAVQVEDLGRTTLFGSQRHAAAFYVAAEQAEACRAMLRAGELAHGVVEEEEKR